MHEFAEEYVSNLTPRDERYDTRLGDDFYVGTFPNGIKTWIYIYEVNGYTRRQTLGVFPEMPLERALEALYAARRTRAVENELREQGLDGSGVRQAEASPIELDARKPGRGAVAWLDRRFFAGAGAGALVTASAALALVLLLWSPAPSEPALAAGFSPAPGAAVGQAQRQAQRVPTATDAHVDEAAVVSLPPSAPGPSADTQAVTTINPALTSTAIEADASDPTPTDEATAPPTELTQSQRAVIDLQRDLSGTLAWAQLTSAVRSGEPVDDLGWIVELGKQPREVFYFVRVRGMAGDQVTYRWSHEGELVKEDVVRVGEGWHSKSYSSVTLTRERIGQWHVEIVGPGDQSLGYEQFETRIATHRLSAR